jgi:hypothetical protein
MRFVSALLAALAVAAAPLAAEIEPGTRAPNFKFTEKWNTPKGVEQFYDYKTTLVLVVSYATYSQLSMDVMADLEALTSSYRAQGFEICAASTENAAEIKTVMIDVKKFTFGLVQADVRKPYQHENMPHSWLVDPKGVVIWRGQPKELKEDALKRWLALYPPTKIVRKVDKLLDESVKQFNRGQFGRAMFEAEKVAAVATTDELKADCAHVLECCNKHAQKYEQQIKDAGKDLVARHKALADGAENFQGCKKGDEWQKAAADLKASKEYEAYLELKTLKAQLEEMKPFQARKKLEALAKKYPETEAGKEAEALAKKYDD